MNSLRTFISYLRTIVHKDVSDLLALQKIRIRNYEDRVAGSVCYRSKPLKPDGRSRASVYVRHCLQNSTANLDTLSSSVAVDVGVTSPVDEVDIAVLSI